MLRSTFSLWLRRCTPFFPFLFLIISPAIIAQAKFYTTDVLVIGGSTGGTAAGIQCARMGVRTIIVEQTPWLGGMLTSGGVSCTDGNDLLPAGMWQEFREALYKHYGTRNLASGWVSETCFEPHVGDSIFKSWVVKEKTLTVFCNWYFDKVLRSTDKVTGAVFKNTKGQMLTIHSKLTIDATDLGDVFAAAGAAYDTGMEDTSYSKESMAPGKYNIIQDITWTAILKDYGKEKIIARPANYDSTLYFCCCTSAPCKQGKPYNVDAQAMLNYGKLRGNKYMINWPAHGNDYYINVVNIKPFNREKLLQAAKQRTLGFIYFIQTQLGFKNFGLADDEFPSSDWLALLPYYREGRRVRGVVRMNVNHLTHPFDQPEKLYRTGIAVGDYPVDHHHGSATKAPPIDFPKVPSFNIPLGALIPEKMNGLIVCEKGISVSNIVNGSTRLQPCVLLTGQAAGILAAKCIKEKKEARKINVREVQDELLKLKCYIMPYMDVLPGDLHWAFIQRIGATGILRGAGIPEGWANKTYFYPDSIISVGELEKGLLAFTPSYKRWTNMFPDKDSLLTIRKAIQILDRESYALGYYYNNSFPPVMDEQFTVDNLKTVWHDIGLENFRPERKIARKELAVLFDAVLKPFYNVNRKVDMHGNFAK